MNGHDKLYQSLELPRVVVKNGAGREIFAKWSPAYTEIGDVFLTDANGYDLVTRPIFKSKSADYFSSSFYPVDASITMGDSAGQRSFTVWNDRPQGGSVHEEDKSIKLLVDRRVTTVDLGGIKERYSYR